MNVELAEFHLLSKLSLPKKARLEQLIRQLLLLPSTIHSNFLSNVPWLLVSGGDWEGG